MGRIGGEEFAVILNECDIQKAIEVANRIQRQLANHPFRMNRETIVYTVSVGISKCVKSDHANTLLERADLALYQAKNNGRNCVKVK